jgi:hypothetical protein
MIPDSTFATLPDLQRTISLKQRAALHPAFVQCDAADAAILQ